MNPNPGEDTHISLGTVILYRARYGNLKNAKFTKDGFRVGNTDYHPIIIRVYETLRQVELVLDTGADIILPQKRREVTEAYYEEERLG